MIKELLTLNRLFQEQHARKYRISSWVKYKVLRQACACVCAQKHSPYHMRALNSVGDLQFESCSLMLEIRLTTAKYI
jgi:hypothetical protein